MELQCNNDNKNNVEVYQELLMKGQLNIKMRRTGCQQIAIRVCVCTYIQGLFIYIHLGPTYVLHLVYCREWRKDSIFKSSAGATGYSYVKIKM